MFDGRIYRAALAPLLLVVVIVGFSLGSARGPLPATLAPDAFDGARAYAWLRYLAARFPDRRPGGSGDRALGRYIAGYLRGLGAPASRPGTTPAAAASSASSSTTPSATTTVATGFQVGTPTFAAQTAEGERTLTDVVAVRPGSTGESAIVLLAHRDALGGGANAELSGTAALLELARVLSQSETHRTIVLVSSSGGSGGDGGAAYFAGHLPTSLDAGLVLGDLAGGDARRPMALGWSGKAAVASERLRATVAGALAQEAGAGAGSPGLADQLAHLALPLSTGEQAPLLQAGVPAVLVQASGERGPAPGEAVSEARLANFGRAALSAAYALDEGPDVGKATSTQLSLGRKTLPGWAVRLLVLALLLAPLVACVDALARLRRRRKAVGRRVAWTLSAALPFFAAALFVRVLAALGLVAAPAAQLPGPALAADGTAPVALAAIVVALGLGLLGWPALARHVRPPTSDGEDAAGLAPLLVLVSVALLVWLFNPFAALLLVPAAHLGLLAAEPRSRALAYGSLALGLAPVALAMVVYAHALGLGPGGLAESVALAPSGGQVGLGAALLWSLALGCVAPLLAHVRGLGTAEQSFFAPERLEVSTRGPLTYAGPGSLGGTESALRR